MDNNDVQEHRRVRLQAAVDKIGSKAELGRLLGYVDGAFIGQMLRGDRPITEKTVEELEGKQGFKGWFKVATFSDALAARIASLDETGFRHLENVMRAHLQMDPLENGASFIATTSTETGAQQSSPGRRRERRAAERRKLA